MNKIQEFITFLTNLSINIKGLEDNEIFLILIDTDNFIECSIQFEKYMSSFLLNNVNSIQNDKMKRKQLIRKGLISILLTNICQINRNELSFTYNEYGKPYISQEINVGNHFFSVSYSDNYMLFSISKNNEIGVDVEVINNKRDHVRLVNRFASDKENSFFSLSSKKLKTQKSL